MEPRLVRQGDLAGGVWPTLERQSFRQGRRERRRVMPNGEIPVATLLSTEVEGGSVPKSLFNPSYSSHDTSREGHSRDRTVRGGVGGPEACVTVHHVQASRDRIKPRARAG